MKKIYKYKLDITDRQTIDLPRDAKLLDIQVQNSDICLWAEIEDDEVTVPALIECFGTGNGIYEDMGVDRFYIATVQKDGFVWHFYKRIS